MSLKVLALIILFAVSLAYSQDYRIVSKQYAWATSSPHRLEFSFRYPEMKNFKDNVTSMNLFNDYIDGLVRAASDTFNVWMRDWDTTTTNHEMGSYYEAGDSVFYKSNSLISIQFYEGYYFSGAAHPNNSSFTVNYDLVNNKALTLNDLLKSGWVNRISEISVKALKEKKNISPETADDWIESGAGPDEKNFRVFNVTSSGLVITFTTYQVGAYVEGPSEVFIPYSSIKDLVNPGSPLSAIVK